ncbi:hypothetical protein J5N97_018407 [Dioscorea zingiberensis]|uniref:UBA domain-containing protein n=1 Tax=Dioscorea zingiberensis TaxID=325984 RepID=A0A9D5HHL3_9LILI|nr:hypothetical protein J5N97_018407 [Dioscorea zingiberensis]
MVSIVELEESGSSSDVEIIEQDLSTAESSDVKPSSRVVSAKRVKVEVSGRYATVKPSCEPPMSTEAQESNVESSESPDLLISVSEESNSMLKSDADCNQENEALNESSNAASDKRLFLLSMEFPDELVDLALNKLGENAPLPELVDFILVALVARSSGEKDVTGSDDSKNQKNKGITEETLLGKTDKTASLLDMGFTEDEVFSAIDNLGPEVPVWELADSIFANRIACGAGEEDLVTSQLRSIS